MAYVGYETIRPQAALIQKPRLNLERVRNVSRRARALPEIEEGTFSHHVSRLGGVDSRQELFDREGRQNDIEDSGSTRGAAWPS